MVVGFAQLGPGEEAELAFIEDENIDEIEQFSVEFDRGRRIEDGCRSRRAGAFEEGANSGQGNLELADRDVALCKRGRTDIGGIDKRIRAGDDDDGVVGIGCCDDGRSGMGLDCFLHEAQVNSLSAKERPQLIAERIVAKPADQCRRRAELRR